MFNPDASYAYWQRLRSYGKVTKALILLHRTEYILGGVHLKTTWQGGGREFTKSDMKRLISEHQIIEVRYDS